MSVLDAMKQWQDLYKDVIVSPTSRSLMSRYLSPDYLSVKWKLNFILGISEATHIECEYFETDPSHQKYRTHAIRIRPKQESQYTEIPQHHAVLRHLDAWSLEHFGRGYRKPGARWLRGRRSGETQRDTYFFRDKKDASMFKFHWHQASLTEKATKLNGIHLY